jgi:hypothetical protein
VKIKKTAQARVKEQLSRSFTQIPCMEPSRRQQAENKNTTIGDIDNVVQWIRFGGEIEI